MTLVEEIIAVASAYAEARGVSMGRVSMLAFGDGQVLKRLQGGSDLTTRRLEGSMLWFSANWPDGAKWPDNVFRPATEDALASRIGHGNSQPDAYPEAAR